MMDNIQHETFCMDVTLYDVCTLPAIVDECSSLQSEEGELIQGGCTISLHSQY